MRTHCIALLTGRAAGCEVESSASEEHWWDGIFRAWPADAAPPRVESVAPEDMIAMLQTGKAASKFDAVLLRSGYEGEDTALTYRVLDSMQQAMLPALMIVREQAERLSEFHPGAVLVQTDGDDPKVTSAILRTLCDRQTAVRAMDQNLRLAQSFQGETAAEIDRLHQELLLAARVQRDFMPKHMPEIDGVSASVLFRPAGFVSGDTYDVSRLDDHHVAFFLADAMGHGVPAALMTLFLTGSMPRKEMTADGYRIVPPGEALSRLNNGLQECMAGPARFATAIAGVVDTRTGEITMACAGHPPPLLVSRNYVKPVDVSGMLLGVVADYQYEQVTIRLKDDEVLVLHSDGIETTFGARSSGGEGTVPTHHAYLGVLRRGTSMDNLTVAMANLAGVIDQQVGSLHQDDDLTILAIQTTPKPAEGREPLPDEIDSVSRVAA